MVNKIIMISILVLVSSLVGTTITYVAKYNSMKDKYMELRIATEEANQRIATMEVDLNKYKDQKPKIIESVVTKYITVNSNKDSSCEDQLNEIRSLVRNFNTK